MGIFSTHLLKPDDFHVLVILHCSDQNTCWERCERDLFWLLDSEGFSLSRQGRQRAISWFMYVGVYVEILHSLVDKMASRLVGNKGQIELLEAPASLSSTGLQNSSTYWPPRTQNRASRYILDLSYTIPLPGHFYFPSSLYKCSTALFLWSRAKGPPCSSFSLKLSHNLNCPNPGRGEIHAKKLIPFFVVVVIVSPFPSKIRSQARLVTRSPKFTELLWANGHLLTLFNVAGV